MKKRKEKELAPKTKLEFAKYIATHLQTQITLADRKAAWVFSVLAVSTGALLTRISKIDWSAVDVNKTMTMLIIPCVFIIMAFIQISKVIYPRVVKGEKGGISYFEDIIQQNKTTYTKQGVKLSEEKILSTLYEESHDLAKIASRKFKTLLRGIILTSIALISTVIILLLL